MEAYQDLVKELDSYFDADLVDAEPVSGNLESLSLEGLFSVADEIMSRPRYAE